MSSEHSTEPTSNLGSKELTLTPTLTALLKPTADYLGQELKSRIASKIDELAERRRQANLLLHLSKVTEETGLNDEVVAGNRQLHLFQEWVERAQDISPEEKTLSKMWETLLVKILKGIDFEAKLMQALSELSESDAALLLKFARSSHYRPKNSKERYQLGQYQFSNLIEESKVRRILNASTAGAAFLGALYMCYFAIGKIAAVVVDPSVLANAYVTILYRLLPDLAIVGVIAAIAGVLVWRFAPSHQLTWFGSELIKHANVSSRDIEVIENRV